MDDVYDDLDHPSYFLFLQIGFLFHFGSWIAVFKAFIN